MSLDVSGLPLGPGPSSWWCMVVCCHLPRTFTPSYLGVMGGGALYVVCSPRCGDTVVISSSMRCSSLLIPTSDR